MPQIPITFHESRNKNKSKILRPLAGHWRPSSRQGENIIFVTTGEKSKDPDISVSNNLWNAMHLPSFGRSLLNLIDRWYLYIYIYVCLCISMKDSQCTFFSAWHIFFGCSSSDRWLMAGGERGIEMNATNRNTNSNALHFEPKWNYFFY